MEKKKKTFYNTVQLVEEKNALHSTQIDAFTFPRTGYNSIVYNMILYSPMWALGFESDVKREEEHEQTDKKDSEKMKDKVLTQNSQEEPWIRRKKRIRAADG